MDFYMTLQQIMEEKGLNVAAVARLCNLPDGTVRSIIARKQKNVALEVAFKLADGLHVSLERLNGDPVPTSKYEQITDKEFRHIEMYRNLDTYGQELVDIVLEKEHVRCSAIPQPVLELISNEQPVDSIEFYSPVSAGYGADLSDTADAKHVKLVANWYTKQADYIVRVDGESMAPRFHHNDRLLVQEADDTEIGEIGIWVINGKHFVKKKGEGKLISLNRDYPDVYPEDDYEQRCQGRVIGVLDPSWIVEE